MTVQIYPLIKKTGIGNGMQQPQRTDGCPRTRVHVRVQASLSSTSNPYSGRETLPLAFKTWGITRKMSSSQSEIGMVDPNIRISGGLGFETSQLVHHGSLVSDWLHGQWLGTALQLPEWSDVACNFIITNLPLLSLAVE
jgi:hypothetical protein